MAFEQMSQLQISMSILYFSQLQNSLDIKML